MVTNIDISAYKRDSAFYGDLNLVLTVKSFDLQAIRQRYIKSRGGKTGKTGSVERRAISLGGLVSLSIQKGKINNERILAKLKEPRGIALSEKYVGISSENEAYIIEVGGKLTHLKDPWFSYIHTLDFSKDQRRILISSSGFDVIMEYDISTLEKTYEWWAWENGFDQGFDAKTGKAITISRNEDNRGKDGFHIVADPTQDSLPTAMRAAFINSVVYDSVEPNKLLATFFHEGKVMQIDQENGKSVPVVSGLKNPHGGDRYGSSYIGTSTGTGFVALSNEEEVTQFDFSKLQGKPDFLAGMEWLQNSKNIGPNIITIDSNRNQFVIFNPKLKLIDTIGYNDNWAVQDMITGTLSEQQEQQIIALNDPAN
ncbi:MAG: hypothetical protein JKY42_02630 [Flavobacteriales bacterium]|nr:hypothetical protein [Flavobacteriales bacterium]